METAGFIIGHYSMKMTIDIVLTVMILGWPGLIMFSPMIFDAPGSEHDKSRILFLLLIILYPTLIFVVYKLVGATYFHLSAKWPLLVTILITAYVVMLFGYPRYIYNAWQGIDDTGYFVAKDAVYFGGVRLKTASAASFEKIGDRYSDYARDARQVYFQGKVLAGADPASFAPVQSSLFWQDKHHVYADGQALSEADPATFNPLNTWYGRDNRHVYYGNKRLQNANPATFQLLGDSLGKDDAHLYVFDKLASIDADMRTLTVLKDDNDRIEFLKDRAHVYSLFYRAANPVTAIIGADPATFVLLGREYAKDKHSVYYRDSLTDTTFKLDGADPSSFVVTGYDEESHSDAKDKYRKYISGKG